MGLVFAPRFPEQRCKSNTKIFDSKPMVKKKCIYVKISIDPTDRSAACEATAGPGGAAGVS
jgi:hypothetical protein